MRQSAFFTLKAAQSQARLQHFTAVGSSQSDFPGAVSCSEPRPTACRDNTAQRTPTFWPQSFPTLHSPKGGSSRYPLSKACTLPPAPMASGLSTQSPGGFFSSHLKQKWPICIRKGVPPCQEAYERGTPPATGPEAKMAPPRLQSRGHPWTTWAAAPVWHGRTEAWRSRHVGPRLPRSPPCDFGRFSSCT